MKLRWITSTWFFCLALVFGAASMGCDALGGGDAKAVADDDDDDSKKKKSGDDDDDDDSKKKKSGDDDDDDDDDSKKKKSGDDDDDDDDSKKKKKSKKAEKYEAGDVLKHVPGSCDYVRAYVDVAQFAKIKEVRARRAEFKKSFIKKLEEENQEGATAFFAALDEEGLDPFEDVRELAICANDDSGDYTIVMGGQFDGKDILGAISKGHEAADQKPKIKDEGGIKYVTASGEPSMGLVTPNILVITKEEARFKELAKEKDRTSTWHAEGKIVSLKIAQPDKADIEAAFVHQGEELSLGVAVTAKGKDADSFRKDPKAIERGINEAIQKMADRMKTSSFKALEDDLRKIQVNVKDATLTLKVRAPIKDLVNVLEAVAAADQAELKRVFQ